MDKADPTKDPRPAGAFVRPFLLLLVTLAIYLCYRILLPFLDTIILAVVLAALFHPLFNWLSPRLGNRESLTAALLTMLVAFVIVLPLLFVVTAMINQGVQLMGSINQWVQDGNLERIQSGASFTAFRDWIQSHFPSFDPEKLDIKAYVIDFTTAFSNIFLKNSLGVLGNLAGVLTNFFVMMIIVFYLSRDGRAMVDRLKDLSPLRQEQEDRIIVKVRSVSRSVLVGSFLTAIVQAVVGGIGLAIVGIPALFWGSMIGFTSLIPVVGSALVSVPVVVYLILAGDWQWAVFFAVWAGVLFTCIDNFLRPLFMRGQAGMSPFWIFLSILGGAQIFGLIGILYGPLIVAFAKIMLDIYAEEFKPVLQEAHAQEAPEQNAQTQEDASGNDRETVTNEIKQDTRATDDPATTKPA